MAVTDPVSRVDPAQRALLVDRDADTRALYAECFRASQFDVDEADDGREALAKAIALHPDVVVTDTVFRGTDVDGPGLIRELRSRLDGETSIIVVSERARREDREQARAAGADCLLVKPVLPNTLLYEVDSALALRQRGRRLPWNWSDSPARSTGSSGPLQRAPAAPLAPAPEAIAARAFDYFVARGAEHGHDVEDWLRAERELAAERRLVRRRA